MIESNINIIIIIIVISDLYRNEACAYHHLSVSCLGDRPHTNNAKD